MAVTGFRLGAWINGAEVAAHDGLLDVVSPFSGEVVAQVAQASRQDLEAAVASAQRAFARSCGSCRPMRRPASCGGPRT